MHRWQSPTLSDYEIVRSPPKPGDTANQSAPATVRPAVRREPQVARFARKLPTAPYRRAPLRHHASIFPWVPKPQTITTYPDCSLPPPCLLQQHVTGNFIVRQVIDNIAKCYENPHVTGCIHSRIAPPSGGYAKMSASFGFQSDNHDDGTFRQTYCAWHQWRYRRIQMPRTGTPPA
ncbi:hypothetical protein D3C76_1229690 [compost metagenome]